MKKMIYQKNGMLILIMCFVAPFINAQTTTPPTGGGPVMFKSLKVYKEQKFVTVELVTDNDRYIEKYEVEKSTDGIQFQKLNAQPGITVNGSTSMVKFTDTKPSSGINYYRVIATSNNNTRDITSIVKIFIDASEIPAVVIYPNPVVGSIVSMHLNNLKPGSYELLVYNSSGQPVIKKKMKHGENMPTETLNIYGLNSGKYDLKISGEGVSLSTSLIKK